MEQKALSCECAVASCQCYAVIFQLNESIPVISVTSQTASKAETVLLSDLYTQRLGLCPFTADAHHLISDLQFVTNYIAWIIWFRLTLNQFISGLLWVPLYNAFFIITIVISYLSRCIMVYNMEMKCKPS